MTQDQSNPIFDHPDYIKAHAIERAEWTKLKVMEQAAGVSGPRYLGADDFRPKRVKNQSMKWFHATNALSTTYDTILSNLLKQAEAETIHKLKEQGIWLRSESCTCCGREIYK